MQQSCRVEEQWSMNAMDLVERVPAPDLRVVLSTPTATAIATRVLAQATIVAAISSKKSTDHTLLTCIAVTDEDGTREQKF